MHFYSLKFDQRQNKSILNRKLYNETTKKVCRGKKILVEYNEYIAGVDFDPVPNGKWALKSENKIHSVDCEVYSSNVRIIKNSNLSTAQTKQLLLNTLIIPAAYYLCNGTRYNLW